MLLFYMRAKETVNWSKVGGVVISRATHLYNPGIRGSGLRSGLRFVDLNLTPRVVFRVLRFSFL